MPDHPNALLLREAGEAMRQGDIQKLDSLVADDIVWHAIGQPQPVVGKEALRGTMATADYEIDFTTHDVVANDEHGVALVEAIATRGENKLTYRTAEIYHLRDGKITERWAFSDDTAAIVDFFAYPDGRGSP